MSKVKAAVDLDATLVDPIDALVEAHRFPDRSQAIESAVSERITRRLASECAKLDPAEERALAGEGLAEDAASWPAY